MIRSHSRINCRDKVSDSNEQLLLFTHDKLVKRVDDELEWINDIERKASSLIAVNGIVLALNVPLFPIIKEVFQNAIGTGNIILFSTVLILICIIIIYLMQLILFAFSFYKAYKGHKIADYIVPSVDDLVDACKNNSEKTIKEILKEQISELDNSLNTIRPERRKKAKSVSESQKWFVWGVIILILLLFVLCITVIIFG